MSKNLEIKANALKGNALRQYTQTITLNAIQKEVIEVIVVLLALS